MISLLSYSYLRISTLNAPRILFYKSLMSHFGLLSQFLFSRRFESTYRKVLCTSLQSLVHTSSLFIRKRSSSISAKDSSKIWLFVAYDPNCGKIISAGVKADGNPFWPPKETEGESIGFWVSREAFCYPVKTLVLSLGWEAWWIVWPPIKSALKIS